MRIRSVAPAIGVMATAVLAFGGSASAATTVGNACVGKSAVPSYVLLSLAGDPTNPFPSAIPSAGVITAWTLNDGLTEIDPSVLVQQKLKVFKPETVLDQYEVVGESSLGTVVPGVNAFPTRIPVQAGDLIGATGFITVPGEKPFQFVFFCPEAKPGDLAGVAIGDPPVGSFANVPEEIEELALPVTVKVEPDADGDGYGDETQDQCPTDASTQGPCPAPKLKPAPMPPAPITLSAAAVAGKGLATVTLTSSAQVSVTVGGSVKLGKSKSTPLSGGTQTVTPGSLAKFIVLFPAKLKARLKQLPASQKLTLSLSASGPGATGTSVALKVKGQKKPKSKPHPKA
jgi:hypothetical protein